MKLNPTAGRSRTAPTIALNLLAPLLGACMPLAFAPCNLYFLAPILLAALLFLWLQYSPRQACLQGWLFGLGMFGVGVSWVYISMHRFGGMGLLTAGLCTGLFIAILSLFPAIQGYVVTRFFPSRKPYTLLLAFPISWTLFEWLRGTLFTGFPWLLLGYSQTNSPLRGYAPILGVYGISWLVALTAGLIVVIYKWKRYLYLAVLLIIWLTGSLLVSTHQINPIGKPITVSLIQGNIPQELKWNPTQLKSTLQHYKKLTQQHWKSDIIIWPEAAIPLPLQYATSYLEPLATQAKHHKAALILGLPIMANDAFYNGAIVIGQGRGTYKKRHLVPFGEYLPLKPLLQTIIDKLAIPMPNFIPGSPQQTLLTAQGITIGMYICYEVAYPSLVKSDLPQAQLLITISNDAWFGHSWASYQHIQMGQMAALTTGRYMLFVANNGVTAVIAPNGKIIQQLPRFTTGVLTATIQ